MGIYYLGTRQSDIAASLDAKVLDDFFDGSIVVYGNDGGAHAAFNSRTGVQPSFAGPQGPEVKQFISNFFADECKKIVEKDKDALFFPYSYEYVALVPKDLRCRIRCANDLETLVYLNSKFNFKKLIQGKINQAPHKFLSGQQILDEKPENVVAQTEYGAGGSGTYFLPKDILKIDPKNMYVVSDFVPNLCSVGVQVQISNNQVAAYPPSIQIMKGPSWIGSDLHGFSKLDPKVQKACIKQAITFGELLREKGIRGFMGLDMIVGKDNRVYAIETNARFTGLVGLLNALSHKANIGSVYKHTYQAFYDPQTNFKKDFAKISNTFRLRHAKTKTDSHGKIKSLDKGFNQEGFTKTCVHQEGMYTHAVYENLEEEISKYNAYDDRELQKEYLSSIRSKPN